MKTANTGNARDMKYKMSGGRILTLAALLVAGLTAACGGGSNVAPPPPMGGYSNSSLNGSYAFSMSGEDENGNPIYRIGSFHADGAGNISAAIEDVNDVSSAAEETFLFTPAPSSIYSVDANGKGVLTLVHPDVNSPTGNDTFTFTIALTSTAGGLLIETDGSSTMSGTFQLQNITTTYAAAYAFDTAGLDLALGTSESLIGSFSAGGNTITSGSLDVNDDASQSGQQTITSGSITPDATYGSQYGRGSLVFNTTINGQVFNLTFAFYVIDANNLIFVETDASNATIGTAIAQSAVPTSTAQLNSGYVMAVGGGAFNSGNFGPITRAAVLTANGNGALTNVALDQNFSGGPGTYPGTNSSISNATYTIDPAGSGRGTLSFTDAKTGYQFSYIFYLASASQGFIQDDSVNVTADGSLTAQSASNITATSLAGNYAFNWSGANANGAGGNEEDFVGVFTIPSAGGAFTNGVVDFAELGVGKIYEDVAFNGMFTVSGSGTGGGSAGNAFQITTEQAVPGTFQFHAYATSNTNFIIVGIDNGRVVIGPLVKQQ
jgi:hypothetical protein